MWRYMAANATGTSHFRHELPCQDRYAAIVEGDWFIAAVCDGAGSAKCSEIGAQIASTVIVDECKRALVLGVDAGRAVREALSVAREAIICHAEQSQIAIRDYSTTALAIVIGPAGGAAAQIGDGLIAIRERGDEWSWVFWPQRGEYANVTHFLVDDNAEQVIESGPISALITDVALMTDGLEPLALHYETRVVHTPFFEGFARPLRNIPTEGFSAELSDQLTKFLMSPKVTTRADDDLTFVLATTGVTENEPSAG
jgi:hypothetical protein